MKNETRHSDDPIEKWIKEAGSDFPGEEFHLSVLKKIEAMPKTSLAYQPVISSKGWKLIIGVILGIIVWSIMMVPAQPDSVSLFDKLPAVKLPAVDLNLFQFNLPAPNLGPQFLIGIGAFFSLGFIMVWGTLRNKQAGV